jgi:uncharacterized membrane protein YuzA (DUF378 family)
MNRFNGLDYTAFVLAIVGALNWGLVGLFQFDLVAALFGGPDSMMSRIVYTLVGLAGVYCAYSLTKTAPAAARDRVAP